MNDNIILPDYENKFLTGQQTQLSIILSNYSSEYTSQLTTHKTNPFKYLYCVFNNTRQFIKLYSVDVDIGPISVILKIYEDNIESIDSETTGRAAVWPTSNWTINKVSLIF